MPRLDDPTRFAELLPAGVLPCVWMSAGLVAYKLCDRRLDCEGCPFDQAMRGAVPEALRGSAPSPAQVPALGEFPADRHYGDGHAWVREVEEGRLRLGVDAFLAGLVGRPQAVILPAAGSRLQRGEAACWLLAGREPIPVRSPVSGVVRRRNPRLGKAPELVTADPYGAGWLLEARPAAGAGAPLLAAAAARERARRHQAELGAEVARLLDRGREAVGPTLPDGGVPLADLRQMLGEGRFRRLLERFLL